MALNDEERFQQQVIAAKIRFYGGHYDADTDAGADEEPGSREPPTFVLSPAYGKQLAVARRVMRGVALERRGELAAARAEYAQGVREFSACIDDAGCAVVVVPRSSGAHEELVNWPEEALYRRAMAGVSLGEPGALADLGGYLRQMDAAAPHAFRAMRRLRANRVYGDGLRTGGGAPVDERVRVHSRQMALLRAAFAFPRADETHGEVLAAVDAAASDLLGTAPRVLAGLLGAAVELTFNAPRVLRHLVAALERAGDFHEAALALRTYEQVAERQVKKASKRAAAAAADADADADTVRLVADVLAACADGARLRLLRLDDAHGALALVHFAQAAVAGVGAGAGAHPELAAAVRATRAPLALWKGAAHARLAQRSREPGNRADHHAAAVQLLRQAAADDDAAADAHFHLALELALGARDVAGATVAAKRAVALDARRLDAWHLLALLSSARKDDAQALRVCDVAMRQSAWAGVLDAVAAGCEPPPQFPADVDAGAQFFGVAVTRMAVEARLRGHEASLAAQPQLFALYGCVFGGVLAGDGDGDGVRDGQSSSAEAANAAAAARSHSSGRRSLARSLLSRSAISRSVLSRSIFSHHSRVNSHGAMPHDARPP
ncbi:hypothetical protein GGF37_005947, partial [Kickxella alabastrina]